MRALMREAFWLLMRFRAATLVLKFNYLTRSLKHAAHAQDAPQLDGRSLRTAVQIGEAVARVGGHTPWQSRCLVQVLAARHMLAARRIPGVFYLGVRKEQDQKEQDQKEQGRPSMDSQLDAHAWLKCGTEIVNGAGGHEAFTVVSSWSWR